jgi:hypothetical protein
MQSERSTRAAGTAPDSEDAPAPGLGRDPVMLVSLGFLGLCVLFTLPPLVSLEARGLYEAGFESMYEAMAGMAAACQWTY